MNLSDRVRLIISENGLKQKEFAASINVTESYISKLIRGGSGLSNSTASLIAERYGYSVDWLLCGREPKMSSKSKAGKLSPLQKKLIFEIEHMSEMDLVAVRAFIHSLEEYKKMLNVDVVSEEERAYKKCVE